MKDIVWTEYMKYRSVRRGIDLDIIEQIPPLGNKSTSELRQKRYAHGYPKMQYFEAEDIIHIDIQDGAEKSSVELSPNIAVELNAKSEIDWYRDSS